MTAAEHEHSWVASFGGGRKCSVCRIHENIPSAASDKGCERCGNRTGHDEITDAKCALKAACTAEIRRNAISVGASPVDAADLLAHFRGIFPEELAYRAADHVLSLGWRKTIGANP